MDSTNSTKKIWLWAIAIIMLAGLIYGGWRFFIAKKWSNIPLSIENTEKVTSWQEKGVVVAGQYADAEVVSLGNNQYRMYYSVEPEVPGNQLEIYSSTSSNGINWTKEDGLRKSMATFPDVVQLPDKKWRMYFQNAGVIKSALSSDGLSWTDEPGMRIDKNETGFTLENVGAQSTTQLEDGSLVMIYRGTINQPYQTTEKLPNQTTDLYFWAISKDGLTFEKKGIAFDSRNETLLGMSDGAEWVNWDDGNLRVYFWGYKGVYYSVLENASAASTKNLQKFSTPVFVFTNSANTQMKFSPNPPCDPTLVNIQGQWFMYYGQHTKGIYYAIYK